MKIDDKWNLTNLPPKGHADTPDFAFNLFEIARIEKDRLGKPGDFLSNYALYRGKQGEGVSAQSYTPVNLYFANIERTVSNITARHPVGEVVDLDGIDDGAEELFTTKLKKWWKDTGQQIKTRVSARTMEIYGITPEKPYWDKQNQRPNMMQTDPFAFFPCPGKWDDMDTEPPYVCFAYLDFVDKVEDEYGVADVDEDNAYELLGVEREKYKTDRYDVSRQKLGNYADPMTRVNDTDKTSPEGKIRRCLVIEVWVRDERTRTVKEEIPVIDEYGMQAVDESGLPLVNEITRKEPVYPDSVRKITITKRKLGQKTKDRSEFMVLDDSANPNINPRLDPRLASMTHPWGKFPVYTANSYKDLVSVWGFAAAEQVGDLVSKINTILSKLIAYVINVMTPPLIVQQHCGITKEMIESTISKAGRLILMPTVPNARIEFMQVPNLPSTFFNVLDMVIKLFDRVSQIEDADRGKAPSGVIAASAIVALQERNNEVRQAKTSAIESLVENRSRWAIGLWQNFGTASELVEVGGDPVEFIGTKYAGRQFSYVVEAGSTTPRTSLQKQEILMKLWETQAVDRRALLEGLNVDGWKEIIERMGETELDAALQVIINAGLPEDQAIMLKQMLMQQQGGPGDTGQAKTPQPGVPRAQQGQVPG